MNENEYENAFLLIRSDNRQSIELGIHKLENILQTDKLNENVFLYNIAYGYYRLGNTRRLKELMDETSNVQVIQFVRLDAVQSRNEASSRNSFFRSVSVSLILASMICYAHRAGDKLASIAVG